MPQVIYVSSDGTETALDARVGDSVMETAVRNGVRGIVAECGGACSCATCHVFVDERFAAAVGGPGDLEDDMLDDAASPRTATSRLSCQIRMHDELDGLVVRIAPEQV